MPVHNMLGYERLRVDRVRYTQAIDHVNQPPPGSHQYESFAKCLDRETHERANDLQALHA